MPLKTLFLWHVAQAACVCRPTSGKTVLWLNAAPRQSLATIEVKGFGKILEVVAANAPLRRNVTIDDVGNVAAFLLSPLAAGVTSEITYVDGGFSHTMAGVTGSE